MSCTKVSEIIVVNSISPCSSSNFFPIDFETVLLIAYTFRIFFIFWLI